MHPEFQSTPRNVNVQINILQHRLNRYAELIGLNASGLAFLGTTSLELFLTMVRVLFNLVRFNRDPWEACSLVGTNSYTPSDRFTDSI